MASIRIGFVASRNPCGVKPSVSARWPSAKIQVTTPNDAVIENRFITIALTGSTSEPNARNSSTSITPTTIRPIHGRCDPTESMRSTVVRGLAADQDVARTPGRPRGSPRPGPGCPRSALLPAQVARSSVVSPCARPGRDVDGPPRRRRTGGGVRRHVGLRRCRVSSSSAVEVSAPNSAACRAATWAGRVRRAAPGSRRCPSSRRGTARRSRSRPVTVTPMTSHGRRITPRASRGPAAVLVGDDDRAVAAPREPAARRSGGRAAAASRAAR